jgi:putative flippase GtrA
MSAAGTFSGGPLRLTTPARFVLAGGLAAIVNFSTRIGLSLVLPYAAAIVIAYFIGMITAFVLNRRYVFAGSARPLAQQMFWFVAINLLALVQTLLVSLLFARYVLPYCGVTWHSEEIAHAIGIVVPIVTSYLGHRHVTFR